VNNMQDTVELVLDWPQPSCVGEPRVSTGAGPLRVSYVTADDRVAALEFAVCHRLIYGHPNDEALASHPLYGRGLQYYSVHRVKKSSRLLELEQASAIHPRHKAEVYLADKEHFVLTFQDATLECLVRTGGRFAPKVITFATATEARAAGWDIA
jgi:hypothetical protein